MDADAFADGRTLAELAALGWSAPATDAGETDELAHAFCIGDWWLIVPPDLPSRIAPMGHCSRLPFTRNWCLGLANHGGELVPVYDLGSLIEANGGVGAPGYCLILGERETLAGLRIDAIASLRIPPETDFRPLFPMPNLPELELTGAVLDGRLHARVDLMALLETLARRASLIETVAGAY